MEYASAYRHMLFGSLSPANCPTHIYWWRYSTAPDRHYEIDSEDAAPDGWVCYEPGVRFSLPMGVAIGCPDWLNCLQVGEDVSKLESWIFFQLQWLDMSPGCDSSLWPTGGTSAPIYEVSGIITGPGAGRTKAGNMIVNIPY